MAFYDDNGVLFRKSDHSLITFPCGHSEEYDIPEETQSIDNNAFLGCSSLTSINIPENVTHIGNRAFDGCKSLRLVTYCGTKADITCDYGWFIDTARIVVPADYTHYAFCDIAVTKSLYACTGCPDCKDSVCKDIISETSYLCSACNPGYEFYKNTCTKCDDGYYWTGKECSECDKSCAACSGTTSNCSMCSLGYKFYDNTCTDCSDGYYKMGKECRDLSTASVFSVEVIDGTDVTPDLIDTVRDGIDDILGCEDCVYVKDNGNGGLDIYLFDNDASDTKDKLDRCLKDSNCRKKFSMIKPINNDPSYGISHRLCIISLFIFIITLFY